MCTSPSGLELDPEIQWNERKQKIESLHCIPSTTGIGASSKRKRVCSPLLSVFLCNRNFSSERESPFGFHLHQQNNNANDGIYWQPYNTILHYCILKLGTEKAYREARTTCVRSKSFNQMVLVFLLVATCKDNGLTWC